MTEAQQQLVCPECGKDDFKDKKHLGRHRRFDHQVIGAKNFRPDGTHKTSAPLPVKRGKKYVCLECGEKCRTPVGLGSHRRREHGITGKSNKYYRPSNIRAANAAKKAAKAAALALTTTTTGSNGHAPASPGRPRSTAVLSPHGFPLQFIGPIVGYLEAKVHEEAFNNDLPARQFAEDVAEYFLVRARMRRTEHSPA